MMVQCLSDEGLPYATDGGDGSVRWENVPDAQMEAFEIARYVCSVKFPRDPSEQEPLTAAQLDRLYDYYTGELTDCVRSLGYEVSKAPSREVFRETYATSPWMPTDDAYAAGLSPEEYSTLAQACSEIPEDLWQ